MHRGGGAAGYRHSTLWGGGYLDIYTIFSALYRKNIFRAGFCYYYPMDNSMDMKTAVIHARVSDKKQAEKNLSIPGQLDAGHILAEELGADVLRIFTEEGVSGWRGKRPEFEDAITYCELNEVDYFITWDTARFSRDSINGPVFRHRLRSSGTAIKYITCDIDPETESGFILEAINQLTDELKSRNTSRDTKRSLIKNAEAGYFNGGRAPFGYEVIPDNENPKRKRLIINASEAAIVKLMVSMRLDKNVGSKIIAETLNLDAKLNRKIRWTKDSVAKLLRNHSIRGVRVYNKKDRGTGIIRPESEWIVVHSHPPIIDEDTWLRLQQTMNNAAPLSTTCTGSARSDALFTGILSCGECGSSMQTETAKGRNKRYRYYNCRGAQKKQICTNRRISVDDLDQWMIDALLDDVFTDKTLSSIIDEMIVMAGDWKKKQTETIRRLRTEIEGITRKQARLYELLEESTPDELNLGDITPRLQDHKAHLLSLERELGRVQSETPPEVHLGPSDVPILRAFLLDTIRNSVNPKKTRTFLQSFIEKIEVGAESVTIHYSPGAMVAAGGKVVHSKRNWLPETSLLRTKIITIPLPEKWHKKAA